MSKRIISIFLVLIMILSCFSINSFALDYSQYTNPTIIVENKNSAVGSNVKVDIKIVNNPGISGAILSVKYATSLTLLSAESGASFKDLDYTEPVNFISGCSFQWDSLDATASEDGVILTLTFKVSENAKENDLLDVAVSYIKGEIYDSNLQDVDVDIVNGGISVINYIPGDVNGDKLVNGKDVTLIRRYRAGATDIEMNWDAADVNDDNAVNGKDVTLIRRYRAGYPVELVPHTPRHSHTLVMTAAKAATCTEDGNDEYWYCTECGKYYTDSNASNQITIEDTIIKARHDLKHIEEKAATTESEGCKEHWVCSVCNKCFLNSLGTNEVSRDSIIISKITRAESSVVYDVYGSDTYLQSVGVANPNVSSFYADEGLILDDLVAPEGYIFKGWTTASGTPITEIAPGSARQITLNAVWEKTPYTISFYSPIAPRSSITRTIDEAYPISDLNELTKYKFMGWTDIYGNEVKIVQPGTKDITLYANWISYRNQTISNDYLSKGPIKIEDEENGQYLFVYDIGKIINVPLYTIKDFGNTTSGIIRVESETVSNSISSTTAKEITEMIANSTTNSATWTLSKNWNELITNTEDFSESSLKENSVLISNGWSHTDGSEKNTGTVKDTGTLSKSNTHTKDLVTHKAGGSLEGELEFGKKGLTSKLSPVGVNIKAEGHYDWTKQGGTETDEGEDTYNLTHTNDLHSESQSTTNSRSEATSEKLAEEVSKKWGYSIAKSTGGEDSVSENSSNTQNAENTYSTTFSYTNAETTTTVKEFSTASAEPGWHRLVCAGTVHVFAVVGYDIATHSYFFYTYSVLDDATSEFYDYSATNGEFNDYEVGVLPFECPVSVHNEVSDKIYLTNGLIIDDKTGTVVGYDGNYIHVNIPDYYSRNNNDGTYDVIKIVAISPSVFAGNTSIESVRLSNYITSIPDGAFKGCSSLRTVEYNHINQIGKNAFDGCVVLDDFVVENGVSSLGEKAFSGVPKLTVNATTKDIAQKATSCGAKNITLNLTLTPEDIKDSVLTVGDTTEVFTINGFKKSYDNIEIISDAIETNINGITFINNKGVPINVSSARVSLDNVDIENAKNLVMLLKAENTTVIVNGTNTFSTSNTNAVLCKNLAINKRLDSSVKCLLKITNGKMYICGEELSENSKKYLEISDTCIEYIDQEKYSNMINSHYIMLDSNGGEVGFDKKLILWGSEIGELPVPIRDYYNFLGWYTEKIGGTRVSNSDLFTSTEDIILYAHWEQKPTSGWVLASELPANAKAVEEKWTYDETTKITSDKSEVEGYTLYDTTSEWGEYGEWSAWSFNAVSASESRQVEKKSVHTGYYMDTYNTMSTGGARQFRSFSIDGKFSSYGCSSSYGEYHKSTTMTLSEANSVPKVAEGAYASNCSFPGYNKGNGTGYILTWQDGGTYVFFISGNVYNPNYRYRDRKLVYTYWLSKTEAKESTSEVEVSESISNVQKWVKYIEK